LEVECLDHWNTENDSHYKDLEAQFKQLYTSIQVESSVHSKFMKRLEASSARPPTFSASTHETFRGKLKSLLAISKQSKEFEDRLEKEYAELALYLGTLKETVRKESTRVCEIRAHIHELTREQNTKRSTLEQEESKIKGIRMQNLASYLSKKSSLEKRKRKTTVTYSTVISDLQAEAEAKLEAVESRRTEIEVVKDKIRAIKTALVKHYSQILKEGKDSRSLGLKWVVMRLWKYEVKVTPDLFPSFLDAQSADVILSSAAKEKEMEDLQDFLHIQCRGASYEGKETFTKPLNNIRSRLIKVRAENVTKQRTMAKYDRTTKQTRIVKEIVVDSDADDSWSTHKVQSDWRRLQSAETRLQSLREQIEEQQSAEVRRIAHDYFFATSPGCHEKDRRLYIATIVGQDAVERHLTLIRKDERDVKLLMEQTKTFSFGSV
jgi:hypothetical protein